MMGTVNHMRYALPNIECDHCILMMRYCECGIRFNLGSNLE